MDRYSDVGGVLEVDEVGEQMKFTMGGVNVFLRPGGIRRLRDQINEHLGEAQKPLPVGTIRVGEGLTDAQNEHLDEAESWKALLAAIHSVSWLRTQEGGLFWRALADRCQNIISAMAQEKKWRETPARSYVAHFSVKANSTGVNLTYDPSQKGSLSPSQARELAAALSKHADAAEGSVPGTLHDNKLSFNVEKPSLQPVWKPLNTTRSKRKPK